MTPIIEDLLKLTFSGTPYACSRWVDELDKLISWEPATTFTMTNEDGQQCCTVMLKRISRIKS